MTAWLVTRQHHSFDCQVVGFGATAGKNDLVAVASYQCTDLAARILNRFGGGSAERVAARRVAVMVGEKRCHCFNNARCDRRGGVEVEVNFLHGRAWCSELGFSQYKPEAQASESCTRKYTLACASGLY